MRKRRKPDGLMAVLRTAALLCSSRQEGKLRNEEDFSLHSYDGRECGENRKKDDKKINKYRAKWKSDACFVKVARKICSEITMLGEMVCIFLNIHVFFPSSSWLQWSPSIMIRRGLPFIFAQSTVTHALLQILQPPSGFVAFCNIA